MDNNSDVNLTNQTYKEHYNLLISLELIRTKMTFLLFQNVLSSNIIFFITEIRRKNEWCGHLDPRGFQIKFQKKWMIKKSIWNLIKGEGMINSTLGQSWNAFFLITDPLPLFFFPLIIHQLIKVLISNHINFYRFFFFLKLIYI